MPLGPCLAEEIVSVLVVQMLRSGVLSPDDLLGMEGLGEDARALVEALIVEASAPRASDWQAEQRRMRLRVVPADGGKGSPT